VSEDAKLKPCPFCGGEATTDKYVVSKDKRKWSAYCRNERCRVSPSTPMSDTEAKAITAWNTRAGEHATYGRGKVEERARIARWVNGKKQNAAIGVVRAEREDDTDHAMYYAIIETTLDEVLEYINETE